MHSETHTVAAGVWIQVDFTNGCASSSAFLGGGNFLPPINLTFPRPAASFVQRDGRGWSRLEACHTEAAQQPSEEQRSFTFSH